MHLKRLLGKLAVTRPEVLDRIVSINGEPVNGSVDESALVKRFRFVASLNQTW